jgi:hypothetical protein
MLEPSWAGDGIRWDSRLAAGCAVKQLQHMWLGKEGRAEATAISSRGAFVVSQKIEAANTA